MLCWDSWAKARQVAFGAFHHPIHPAPANDRRARRKRWDETDRNQEQETLSSPASARGPVLPQLSLVDGHWIGWMDAGERQPGWLMLSAVCTETKRKGLDGVEEKWGGWERDAEENGGIKCSQSAHRRRKAIAIAGPRRRFASFHSRILSLRSETVGNGKGQWKKGEKVFWLLNKMGKCAKEWINMSWGSKLCTHFLFQHLFRGWGCKLIFLLIVIYYWLQLHRTTALNCQPAFDVGFLEQGKNCKWSHCTGRTCDKSIWSFPLSCNFICKATSSIRISSVSDMRGNCDKFDCFGAGLICCVCMLSSVCFCAFPLLLLELKFKSLGLLVR